MKLRKFVESFYFKTEAKNFFKKASKFFYVFFISLILLWVIFSIFFSLSKIDTSFTSFEYLFKLFSYFFTNYANDDFAYSKLPTLWTFYLLIGLVVAICFRSGIFNLNISGQLIISGTVLMNFLNYFEVKNGVLSSWNLLLGLIVSILSAAFSSLLVGFLKACFNIHEVVTSIFLNWVSFYISKNSFTFGKFADISVSGRSRTLSQESFDNFWGKTNFHWFLFTIAVILAIIILIIFRKTSLGYKMEVNNLSEQAAAYSGYNRRALILGVTFFSGCITGLAAFILYVIQEHYFSPGILPTTKGFSAISLSLLANHSSLGIIFTSWFFASLDINITYVTTSTLEITSNLQELIEGVFTFVVAISPIFLKIKIFEKIKHFFIYLHQSKNFIRSFLLYKLEEIKNYLLLLRDLFLANLLKLKLYFKARKIRKKIDKLTYDFTKNMVSSKKIKMEFFNSILLEKKRVHSELEKLGYFKKEAILNSYNLARRKRKQTFIAYKSSLLESYYFRKKTSLGVN